MSAIDFMSRLDGNYRRASGLSDKRFYKIYYSSVGQCEVLILGINPGGNPLTERPSELISASTSYYEKGEHDYVDCKYKAALMMLPLLLKVFDGSEQSVRRTVKTNLSFRRSASTDPKGFKAIHKISLDQSYEEAKPFVEEIIERSNPKLILLEGGIVQRFANMYCRDTGRRLGEIVTTPNGSRDATLFEGRALLVRCLRREVPTVQLGHPSKFGPRYAQHDIARRIKQLLPPSG